MDIEKMKNKALRNGYRSIRSFYKDFELMIENCYCYNAVTFYECGIITIGKLGYHQLCEDYHGHLQCRLC